MAYHQQVSSCCFGVKLPPVNSAGVTCRCPTPFLRCTPCKQHLHLDPPCFAASLASPARAVVMGIQELVENILLFLDDPIDLVHMACTAKRYTDTALRLAWDSPSFTQPPLVYMSGMDPELGSSQDSSLQLPSPLHRPRFDYYAPFVRHLRLWQLESESYISRLLTWSRPGQPLFPFLKSIHIGAEGDAIALVRPYLSSSVRSICVDHWDSNDPFEVRPSDNVTAVLLDILRLPHLEFLDLMDTRYFAYESCGEVLQALAKLLPRLRGFYSYDFTTLGPLFDILSESTNLTELFLDLSDEKDLHVPLSEAVSHLRSAFLPLRKLVILSSGQTAAYLLNTAQRRLTSIDLRIEGSLNADGLGSILASLASAAPTLTAFRCTSSESCPEEHKTTLLTALQPLRKMARLAHVHITISFRQQDMPGNDELAQLFACWPDLRSFCLEADPDEGPMRTADELVGRGPTLECVLRIPQCAPRLREITLSYVDGAVIPDLETTPHRTSSVPLTLHFSRSHVHDPDAVADFLAELWPAGRFSFDIFCMASRGVSTEDD